MRTANSAKTAGVGQNVRGLTSTSSGIGFSSAEEASKTSPSSSEAPASRVMRRQVKSLVGQQGSGDSLCGTGIERRVLRDRVAPASLCLEPVERSGRTKNVGCRERPENTRRRGRATGLSSKNANAPDVIKTKPTTRKALTRVKKSRLTRSGKGQHRRSTSRVTRSKPVTVSKNESKTWGTSCGEAGDTLKVKDGNSEENAPSEDLPSTDDPSDPSYNPEAKRPTREKSRRRLQIQKEEVRGHGSEVKLEVMDESMTADVKVEEEEIREDVEQPRKRGRRRKDDRTPQLPKKRKKPPVQYVRCEMEGCGTVLAHPRYLQHHIKYQHLLKKKYVCNHPSCGRLFRLQKQLLRHAKHHTDQRDYICEFCARAFKSSHNLAVHRMIHTGEKPIQCEICGFTCRQKASLNWHMKKHDADAFYQFSCSICGKKFEKKDCVVAHKAKSHPEVLIAEALAANTSPLLSVPAPERGAQPGTLRHNLPPKSQENQSVLSGAPPQRVVLPYGPQTQTDFPKGQLPLLASHHTASPRQQPETPTPTLLHFTTMTTSAKATSTIATHAINTFPSEPHFVELTAAPTTMAVSSALDTDPHTTLLTLSSVTTLTAPPAPAITLLPHPSVEWVRQAEDGTHLTGEGILWDRVVVGGEPDVGEIYLGDDGGRVRDDEMVWERDGGRQILLGSAEAQGDGLI